jgi:hypothetical protein
MARINRFNVASSWIPWCILLLFTRSSGAVADLLFLDTVLGAELGVASSTFTTHVATAAEWAGMSADDFAKYKAIILGDPNSENLGLLDGAIDTREKWSKAVKNCGNIVVLG